MAKRKQVKEPVQVYLERSDLELLGQVARRLALPRTEVLRRGLRGLAAEVLGAEGPALAFLDAARSALPGDVPPDLGLNHDRYLADPHLDTHRQPAHPSRRAR